LVGNELEARYVYTSGFDRVELSIKTSIRNLKNTQSDRNLSPRYLHQVQGLGDEIRGQLERFEKMGLDEGYLQGLNKIDINSLHKTWKLDKSSPIPRTEGPDPEPYNTE
jgi:hypothetical protein